MKNGFTKKVFFLGITFVMLIPLKFYAAKPDDSIPDNLLPAVNHLLTYMESNKEKSLNLDFIPQLLDFIAKQKTIGETMSLGKYKGAVSDYYEFSVNRSLEEVLDLAYNPDLPENLTMPSSVRLAHWIGADGQNLTLPRLSDKLDNLDNPLIIKGSEFVENSPDTFSGAYYSYNVDRLLILIKYNGRPALISVSKQKGPSDVGKKGLILGNDDEWNYIYSGEKGTTLKGTGWANTYIYDSASIMVYYEIENNPSQVKCAVFKWIDAGWMNMNFVRPFHIRKGLVRFAKDFCKIVESPSLTDTKSLVQEYQSIQSLSLDELKAKTAECYNLTNIDHFQIENSKNEKWVKNLFKEGKYIDNLNRQEMEALVSIEYLKYKMGKYNTIESDYFPGLSGEEIIQESRSKIQN